MTVNKIVRETIIWDLEDEIKKKDSNLDHLKDNVYAMQKQLERTEKALRFAAGIISTYPPHDIQHPLEVYEWILKEADYDNGG